MKKRCFWFLIVLFLFLFSSNTFASLSNTTLIDAEILSNKTIDINGTKIQVWYGNDEYYLKESGNVAIIYIDTPKNVKNKIIQVNGTTYTIEYSSSNKKIARINENGLVRFMKPGNVTFSVLIGDKKLEIPVEIMEMPFKIKYSEPRTHIPTDVLVEKIGFPDEEKELIINFPDELDTLDGVSYRRSSDSSSSKFTHWHYNKYPNLIFRISWTGECTSIYSKGWHGYYTDIVISKTGIDSFAKYRDW